MGVVITGSWREVERVGGVHSGMRSGMRPGVLRGDVETSLRALTAGS